MAGPEVAGFEAPSRNITTNRGKSCGESKGLMSRVRDLSDFEDLGDLVQNLKP
jgi:hypothetical protein